MFNKDLIDRILNGSKTMTSRDKPQFEVGETTNLMANRDYSKLTGNYIRITKLYKKPLSQFTAEDSKKEGFANLEEFQTYWTKNIGPWAPSKEVWVHEFEVIADKQ